MAITSVCCLNHFSDSLTSLPSSLLASPSPWHRHKHIIITMTLQFTLWKFSFIFSRYDRLDHFSRSDDSHSLDLVTHMNVKCQQQPLAYIWVDFRAIIRVNYTLHNRLVVVVLPVAVYTSLNHLLTTQKLHA